MKTFFFLLLFSSPGFAVDYGQAIADLRPGEEWVLRGSDYNGLVWLSTTTKPTRIQIQGRLDRLIVLERRQKLYPNHQEILMALIKGGVGLDNLRSRMNQIDSDNPLP